MMQCKPDMIYPALSAMLDQWYKILRILQMKHHSLKQSVILTVMPLDRVGLSIPLYQTVKNSIVTRGEIKMSEILQYCRKNRGQVAKDVSVLLAVKNIKDIRIVKRDEGIYVYSGGV